MNRHIEPALVLIMVCAVFSLAGCGGSSTSPSAQPQIIQGSRSLAAAGTDVVNFVATRAGSLSASVDWTNADHDIDTFLVGGTCLFSDLLNQVAGCVDGDIMASDDSLAKPAVFTATVTERPYTLILSNSGSFIVNFNLFGDANTVTWRIEIN